jgi:hypothetical protein
MEDMIKNQKLELQREAAAGIEAESPQASSQQMGERPKTAQARTPGTRLRVNAAGTGQKPRVAETQQEAKAPEMSARKGTKVRRQGLSSSSSSSDKPTPAKDSASNVKTSTDSPTYKTAQSSPRSVGGRTASVDKTGRPPVREQSSFSELTGVEGDLVDTKAFGEGGLREKQSATKQH